MTALAMLAGPEPVDVPEAMARFSLVRDKLNYEPEGANIQNCERSLRLAAQAIVQEWRRVQMLKADPNALKPQPKPVSSVADVQRDILRLMGSKAQAKNRERTKTLREVPQLTHA